MTTTSSDGKPAGSVASPAPPASWRRVEVTLIRAAHQLRQVFDQRLAEIDLNLNQASLLAFVADFGSRTQTELAEMVGLGRAATGTMIDQLETRQLVERLPDPDDRRVWRVGITPAGLALVDRFLELDATLRKELRSGISRDERQQLASLLVRLSDNVELAKHTTESPKSD